MIHERVIFLSEKYDDGTMEGYCRSGSLIQAFHKDELESYKIKLENYYCDTDLKDQLYLVYYLESFVALKLGNVGTTSVQVNEID